jgi:hypothetical protein
MCRLLKCLRGNSCCQIRKVRIFFALVGEEHEPSPSSKQNCRNSDGIIGKLRRQLWEDLLRTLARDLVPLRPDRQEPRAVKRPKPYPLLNQPRRRFVEIPNRGKYWKGRPPIIEG